MCLLLLSTTWKEGRQIIPQTLDKISTVWESHAMERHWFLRHNPSCNEFSIELGEAWIDIRFNTACDCPCIKAVPWEDLRGPRAFLRRCRYFRRGFGGAKGCSQRRGMYMSEEWGPVWAVCRVTDIQQHRDLSSRVLGWHCWEPWGRRRKDLREFGEGVWDGPGTQITLLSFGEMEGYMFLWAGESGCYLGNFRDGEAVGFFFFCSILLRYDWHIKMLFRVNVFNLMSIHPLIHHHTSCHEHNHHLQKFPPTLWL